MKTRDLKKILKAIKEAPTVSIFVAGAGNIVVSKVRLSEGFKRGSYKGQLNSPVRFMKLNETLVINP